jgi:cation transport ATPase
MYDTFVSIEIFICLVAFIIHMIYMKESDLYFLYTSILLFLTFVGYGIINILNDRSRHLGDNRVNNQPTRKFNFESNTNQDCLWKDLLEGDIIEVLENEEFPAD